jgi:hypothetical protein
VRSSDSVVDAFVLPRIAEPELGANGRMLLGHDDEDYENHHKGGKGGNPAKAKWEPKTNRLTDIHFVQVRSSPCG